MIKGFREFILRGNVIDLAVAVVIGAAFTGIVNTLVSAFINPLIGLFFAADSLNEALAVPVPTLGGGTVTFAFGAIISGAPITYLDWLLWFLPVLLLNLAGGVLLVTLLRIVRTGELFELRRRKNAGIWPKVCWGTGSFLNPIMKDWGWWPAHGGLSAMIMALFEPFLWKRPASTLAKFRSWTP
ncbi:MscL family protein [uncultured Microbacterium sp.]|uniref:MscL family protein n=1 Tax=uncultured Microbacterium sp. TaxID=191216 RepID=UPI0025EE617A|nr:MscL family protein [uncultured Microbacterium sp.]